MELRRILLDLETQRDFFSPGGSCYVRPASGSARHVGELFTWARRQEVPVISTLLRVRRQERGPLAPVPHCIEDGDGERKIECAVLRRRTNLGLRNVTDLDPHIFDRYQQVIFEKRDTDIFKHPRIERLITRLGPTTFVICGAGVADGIVQAAVGLRARNFGVIVASDAVLDFDDPRAEMAYLRMEAKGVVFAPTARIVAPVVPHRTEHPHTRTRMRTSQRGRRSRSVSRGRKRCG
jgi:nicotinamidase-related amidase